MKPNGMKTVNISAPGPTSLGAKLTYEDGTEIHGIRKAVITLEPNSAIVAALELIFVSVDVRALPKFYGKHPITGELKEVAYIQFVDGSTFGEPAAVLDRKVSDVTPIGVADREFVATS